MMLSIITVVRNDLRGLKDTIASVSPLLCPEIEHLIIDGSNNNEISSFLQANEHPNRKWVSEPDDGIYDAMNKGLSYATGDYAIFLNAGDIFFPNFSPIGLFNNGLHKDCVIIGRTVEVYEEDRYLRPGLGNEENVFQSPPHQATFYPRIFYSNNKFRLDRPINGDGNYTARAIRANGAVFVSSIISEFSLGGISSRYDLKALKLRLLESHKPSNTLKLIVKSVIWHLISRRKFYQLLATWKYTKLTSNIQNLSDKPTYIFQNGSIKRVLNDQKVH